MKHFKVKKLKVTKPSTDRVLVRAKPLPKVKPKPGPTSVIPGAGKKHADRKAAIKADVEAKATDLSKKEAARQRYRNEHGVAMTSCAANLAQLPDLAKMHTVTFPDGKVRTIPAFTVTAMGEPLDITGVTVTRWVNKGMIPAPILTTSRGKVYGIEEARTIVRLIGDHQRDFRQYRDEHSELRDKIFQEVARIRKGLYQPK